MQLDEHMQVALVYDVGGGGGGKEAAVGWLHRESCVGGGERGTYVGDGVL
jgi:hypothetical protein